MGINISRSALESSQVRSRILSSLGGERRIDISTAIVDQGDDVGLFEGFRNNAFDFVSGILGNGITSFLARSAGWLAGTLGSFVSWSFSSAWAWGQEQIIRLWSFDWNTTDEELQQQIRQSRASIASVWGSAFGSAVGWSAGVAIGYGIGMTVPVIGSKALAKTLAASVAGEGLEEISAQMKGALRITLNIMAENQVRATYISSRKLLRDAQLAFTQVTYGDEAAEEFLAGQSAATSWGGSAAPSWSFSSAVENQVEKLPGNWRIFASSFLDEFGDSLFEAGYLIAQGLDAAVAARNVEKLANPERGAVLYPDRDSPDERVILVGAQSDMKAQAQTSLDTWRQLRQKDVGELVGLPSYEIVTPATSKRTLTITYSSYDRPPYNRAGVRAKKSYFTIPDAKAGISFTELKAAFRQFNYGGHRVGVKLDNGRQMAVYAATDAEGEEMLRTLLTFTTAEPTGYVYTDVNKGVSPARRKEIEIRYPYKASSRYVRGDLSLGTQTVTEESMLIWRDEPINVDRFT